MIAPAVIPHPHKPLQMIPKLCKRKKAFGEAQKRDRDWVKSGGS
jgi:hypothetical protein